MIATRPNARGRELSTTTHLPRALAVLLLAAVLAACAPTGDRPGGGTGERPQIDIRDYDGWWESRPRESPARERFAAVDAALDAGAWLRAETLLDEFGDSIGPGTDTDRETLAYYRTLRALVAWQSGAVDAMQEWLAADEEAPLSEALTARRRALRLDAAALAGDCVAAARQHYLALVDAAGNETYESVNLEVDGDPPLVSILSPAPNAQVSGVFEVQLTASDVGGGPAWLQIEIAGTPVATAVGPEATALVDTADLTPGEWELTATAIDQAGLETSASIPITVVAP